ncbi:MAG: hypothetical protein HQK49_15260 [Oligoflexia bacterium]|nr:hypothetical protein [Oligoflexia bacterium]
MNSMFFLVFGMFLIFSFSACFADQPIRVADSNTSGISAPINPVVPGQVGLVPEGLGNKSLDELKDMCLNPSKYHLQTPTLKLEVTGILTWTKWIKKADPVYLVETQKINNFGSFTKNGSSFDGKEWKIVDGKLSDIIESNSSCLIEGVCVEYVEHIYTRDLMSKSVTCENIAKSANVRELYGLSLENVAEITSAVPVNGDVTPIGYSDTITKVYPAACPKVVKPTGIEMCKVTPEEPSLK